MIEQRTFASRAEWLEARRETIGASEAAAALGMSPWESPRELYLRKRGLMPDVVETQAMRIGSMMEPVIAQLYEEETGLRIVEQQVFVRSTLDPLSATIDGVVEDGRLVEMKTVGGFMAKEIGEGGWDQLPDHWLIQAHQQMLLYGANRVDFAVLVGGTKFRVFIVHRIEEVCEEIAARVPAFWSYVAKGITPPGDGRAEPRIQHLLYPGCAGEIALPLDAQLDVDLWVAMKEQEKESAEAKEKLKGLLLERLGNHETGRLPDGRVIRKQILHTEAKEITYTREAGTQTRLYLKGGR